MLPGSLGIVQRLPIDRIDLKEGPTITKCLPDGFEDLLRRSLGRFNRGQKTGRTKMTKAAQYKATLCFEDSPVVPEYHG